MAEPDELHVTLVGFVRRHCDPEVLLGAHQADGSGRCRGCQVRGVCASTWPCELALAAAEALGIPVVTGRANVP